jgi:RHS repeat-associated protein
VSKTPEVLGHDADGNLTADGRWSYTWDGENRLTGMETLSVAVTAGAPRLKLAFAYDANHRRIQKIVSVWNAGSGSYVVTKTQRFVYEAWNLLAELDASNQPVRKYFWGLDLSGSEQEAGGVGGLLFETDAATATTCLPAYDGNGNIVALINATNASLVASYEYGPFGEVLRATGPMADANPFRFSTKYTDQVTGLLYYGRRLYIPNFGRWLNRDLLGESGGFNLNGFCNGNPVNLFDTNGLRPSAAGGVGTGAGIVTGTGAASGPGPGGAARPSGNGSPLYPASPQTPDPTKTDRPWRNYRLWYQDEEPLSTGKCGQFNWMIAWNLSPAAPDGGQIVQQIKIRRSFGRCDGSFSTTREINYTESWNVYPAVTVGIPGSIGGSASRHPGSLIEGYGLDTFANRQRQACRGSISFRATAAFFQRLVLPPEMSIRNVPYAGSLRSRFGTWWPGVPSSNVVNRNVTVNWDCCGGDESTKFTYDENPF